MKKLIKYILVAVLVIMVLASVAVNAYFVGWKYLQTSLIQQGETMALIQLVQQGKTVIGDYVFTAEKATATPVTPTPLVPVK